MSLMPLRGIGAFGASLAFGQALCPSGTWGPGILAPSGLAPLRGAES